MLWITSTELVVKFDGRRSLRHQRQQIFHEFAHVLCDHEPDGHYRIGASGLTEGMDPASIEAVMHRDCFDAGSEAEAELVGTKLAMLSQGTPRTTTGASTGRPHSWNFFGGNHMAASEFLQQQATTSLLGT